MYVEGIFVAVFFDIESHKFGVSNVKGPLLLTWFNFNLSMDK